MTDRDHGGKSGRAVASWPLGKTTAAPSRLLALLGLLLAVAAAGAQSAYPNRPVQLIISYGAGSTGDVSMRILMEQLSAKLGQPFLVINKPGAGGVAAAQSAAATPPDGYTLLLTGNSSTISVALFKSLPYNILTDFAPVSMVANFDMVVLVKAGSPLKSMQDIVAYAKANPGKLNVGTLAPGTTQYLAAELFKIATGTDVATVPFRTSPDMMTALLRGDVDVDFEFFAPMQALLADHKVTPIATTGKTRADFLPDIPTVMESGIAEFRRDELERYHRSRRYAAADHRYAQPGDDRCSEDPVGSGSRQAAGHGDARQHAGATDGAAQERHRQVDGCRREGAYPENGLSLSRAANRALSTALLRQKSAMSSVSSDDRFPAELDANIPPTLADFLRPGRVALVMWDMQKGLAGRSPAIDQIVPNANALIDAAERGGFR